MTVKFVLGRYVPNQCIGEALCEHKDIDFLPRKGEKVLLPDDKKTYVVTDIVNIISHDNPHIVIFLRDAYDRRC